MTSGMVLSTLLFLAVCTWTSAQMLRKPPVILEPTVETQRFFKTGEDGVLLCRAQGIPAVVYEWLRDGSGIESEHITFDANIGTLRFSGITQREEGFFRCKAKNIVRGQEAVAISPEVEVRIARVGYFPPGAGELRVYSHTVGQYARLSCDEQLPVFYGPTTLKWYESLEGTLHEVVPDQRHYIDQEGDLHFIYVDKADANREGGSEYRCAMANTMQGLVRLGEQRQALKVTPGGPIQERSPSLEYMTSGDLLTVKLDDNAKLECVFSGYENSTRQLPVVTWFRSSDSGDVNQTIYTGGRYTIEGDGRTLIIKNVVEQDENDVYFCKGENGLGVASGRMKLNVTSRPIWVNPLRYETVPEGQDATLSCVARSAVGEAPPGPPEWYKNGVRMDNGTDLTKYVWTDEKRMLTVRNVMKDTDIDCFQCYVENSVGQAFSQGCLNVILPITVTEQPSLHQTVSKGDIVSLTVTAVSDPLTQLQYRWIFNNVTYENGQAPPYVIYDPVTLQAYINTSTLTDEEFQTIGGTYRREIYDMYQTVRVDVEVTLKGLPTTSPLAVTMPSTTKGLYSTSVPSGMPSTTGELGSTSAPSGTDGSDDVQDGNGCTHMEQCGVLIILAMLIACQ